MIKILIILSLSALTASCGNIKGPNPDETALLSNYFKNSRRAAINIDDLNAMAIVTLKGCSGFFVKNNEDKNLIATARPCFDSGAKSWCQGGGQARSITGKKLTCQKIIAGDKDHDMVIFQFKNNRRNKKHDLKLGHFSLRDGQRLSMLGYPKDFKTPNNDLIRTDNCWVNSSIAKTTNASDYFKREDYYSRDKVFGHNCTTFLRNSGGPILLEGSNIVVGLPNSFRDDLPHQSSDQSADALSIYHFIQDFYQELDEAGVSLSYSPCIKPGHHYLRAGVYKSTHPKSCTLSLSNIHYQSGPSPHTFDVSLEGSNCQGMQKYYCDRSGYCESSGRQRSIQLSGQRFVLKGPNSTIHYSLFE